MDIGDKWFDGWSMKLPILLQQYLWPGHWRAKIPGAKKYIFQADFEKDRHLSLVAQRSESLAVGKKVSFLMCCFCYWSLEIIASVRVERDANEYVMVRANWGYVNLDMKNPCVLIMIKLNCSLIITISNIDLYSTSYPDAQKCFMTPWNSQQDNVRNFV